MHDSFTLVSDTTVMADSMTGCSKTDFHFHNWKLFIYLLFLFVVVAVFRGCCFLFCFLVVAFSLFCYLLFIFLSGRSDSHVHVPTTMRVQVFVIMLISTPQTQYFLSYYLTSHLCMI